MIEKFAQEVNLLSYEELGNSTRFSIQRKAEQLYHMHELMTSANDEELYMRWIVVFPDGATLYDFIEVALDDELFNDCYNLFLKLIAHKDYL